MIFDKIENKLYKKKIMFLKILIEFIEIFYICFVNIKKLVRQNRLTLKYFILKSISFIKNILKFFGNKMADDHFKLNFPLFYNIKKKINQKQAWMKM